jgi:hypothetical protein
MAAMKRKTKPKLFEIAVDQQVIHAFSCLYLRPSASSAAKSSSL